jgi:protein-S-isoprenylcysteine O-methyltransferase Ste14
MAPKIPDAPNPLLPPPLIFALFFIAGALINQAFPLQFLPLGWNMIPGVLLSLGGLGIFIAAALTMRKFKTPVSPYKTAKTLITTGPFLRSRNPIYLALIWIYLGLASFLASWWPIFLFPFLVYVLDRFVIAREEAHLEKRFGNVYRDYKASTRRWM